MTTTTAPSAVRSEPDSTSADLSPGIDPLWYRSAVIYQMHVRSFSDSNGDGIGDFNGLVSRLDYLQDLGVTAIWLLPFYPSPLKDDGYDIADYTSVNPSYGTFEDGSRFIDEAHRRQLRVITELVINHTSDQHAWFQRARRAPKGSPERDFYVWSDTPEQYAGVRIIFKDFEPSNWTFDHLAGQYYWHRFFHHQPDLNFDNLAVHDAVLEVCDMWMKAGVDGVRLDAVPYLYEREGTSCENLPETHAFLRKLRSHVDKHWPGRMLLAEANQWPEDAIAYFGDGDECQMNFHFPLMPRLFMSLRMEDRYPIIDILEQTPPIPPTAQWAMFLRNHDELTLEMVTDEERDYMWRVYANDPAARINLGIRRRLAPLLDNNRRKIELMNGLLFSMPGTPVLYYGDEIGMGDNIFLGDRNGVRTPMQWSADRNAGFSQANPQRLFLPLIIDPEYHYETINVEAQQANTSSLLWWMKRLIALRKRHAVFGTGEIHFLTPTNAKVLAFMRQDANERILVVANLSRFSQPVELNLSDYKGQIPVEMFGNVRFPVVGDDGRYTLSIGPHGFFWFLMKSLDPVEGSAHAGPPPVVRISSTDSDLLAEPLVLRELELRLPRWLPARRWFVSKAKTIRAARIVDQIEVPAAKSTDATTHVSHCLFIVRIEFAEGEADLYALPVSAIAETAEHPSPDGAVLARVERRDGRRWALQDAMLAPMFARTLLDWTMLEHRAAGRMLRLAGRRIIPPNEVPNLEALQPKVPETEQSNSNVVFGDRLIFKLFRRLGEGVNPELEVGEHLTAVGFANTAPLLGAVELRDAGGVRTLALAMGFVPNQGDAWATFLDNAQRYFERLDTRSAEEVTALCLPGDAGCDVATDGVPDAVKSAIGEPLELARLLARRTAEMHAAMADDRGNASFTPEPFSAMYQRSLLQSLRNATRLTMQALASRGKSLSGESAEMARSLLTREADLLRIFHELTSRPIRAPRIRCHGDYHLGQVLWTGKDFVIVDFEGEPLQSIGERRLKRSPMKDVAGMVRSFDYAAWTALRRHEALVHPQAAPVARERGLRGAMVWGAWLSHEFVQAYVVRMEEMRSGLIPREVAEAQIVLRSWVLDKALYEVRYELNARPDWVDIPLRAILNILGPVVRRGGAHPPDPAGSALEAAKPSPDQAPAKELPR